MAIIINIEVMLAKKMSVTELARASGDETALRLLPSQPLLISTDTRTYSSEGTAR
jgi:hypothetical protein